MTYENYEAGRARFVQLEKELKLARKHNLTACIAFLESEMTRVRASLKAYVDSIQV